jgi:hypothetical protein
LLRGEARGIYCVEPQGNVSGNLINVIEYLIGGAGDMENWVEVREAK